MSRSRRMRGRKSLGGRLGRRRVPRLEICEQRLVLATDTWIGGAHINADQVDPHASPSAWSNPENWLGGVPGPGDTAVFSDNVTFSMFSPSPGKDVTFNHPFNTSPELDSDLTVTISADSSFGGALTVDSGVTLTLAGSNTWDCGGLGGIIGPGGIGTVVNPKGSTLTFQNPSTSAPYSCLAYAPPTNPTRQRGDRTLAGASGWYRDGPRSVGHPFVRRPRMHSRPRSARWRTG